MGFFERVIKSPQYKWLWYSATLTFSCIPLILRFLVSLDTDIKIFDIKDLLFAGLAMNLSNLNLVGHKNFDEKMRIVVMSLIFIMLISFFLGIFFVGESAINKNTFPILQWFACLCVFVSMYVSYEANNYVFQKT